MQQNSGGVSQAETSWIARMLCLKVVILGILLLAPVPIKALPTGAPVDACVDLTPRHLDNVPSPCGPNCPFSLALTAIDGAPPSGPLNYRCGSQHTIRVQTSDPSMTFRGLVVQGRENTPEFTNAASFVGSFVNPVGLWRIWDCNAPSATHTSRVDKTAVDLTWQAPDGPSNTNVTMWFSIVRMFTNFHVQMRGLDLGPDPSSCAPPPPEPLELSFINDSPDVQGNNISANIQFSRPVDVLRCALTGIPYQNCASGSVTFTNVPPRENDRPYILRVVGNTTDGVRTVIRRVVRIEQPNICTVQLINDGVTVDGNSATVEFSSRGPAEEFLCSLDRQPLQPCSMTQTFPGLSVGDHRLKIVPEGCGRNRRPLVVRFTVEEVPSK